MNFVAQLEDYLRDLGSESRKKHPGVKEASERANIRLRSLKNDYVSAVRKATSEGAEHPTTALFQSQDLLHPFLLAANYPNASTKLLDITFKAMRLLMESNAICTGDGIHMVRVWTIQAHVIMSQYQKHNKSANKKDGDGNSSTTTNGSGSKASSIASTTASWLGIGGLLGGSSASSSPSNGSANDTSKQIKNAVSSSSGQSGQYNAPSNKDMEKIALEILSCLLKLTELLKHESPSNDLWTQSVSLCCILLDFKKTVQQAAKSTLPQVLSILYQSSNGKKYNLQTWEDLLSLASYGPSKKAPSLQGAFSQCRVDRSSAKTPPPPSPEFALELMATILKERPDLFAASDKFLSKTMGVTVALLQQTSSKTFDLAKTLRVFQWTLAVLQTQAAATIECRELLMHVIKPIHTATEACRAQNDLDDGYVYIGGDESSMDASANGGSSSTLVKKTGRRVSDNPNGQHNPKAYTSLLPTRLLWKAGLAVETVYHVLLHCSRAMQLAAEEENGDDNMDSPAHALVKLLDRPTIVLLTETLSDFATIGAGCQSHILQLVDVCRKNNRRTTSSRNTSTNSNSGNSSGDNNNTSTNNNGDNSFSSLGSSHRSDFLLRSLSRDEEPKSSTAIEPMMFIRAEQVIKSGSLSALLEENNQKANGDKKTAAASTSPSQSVHVMGEALWISFHGVVEIVASLLPNAPPDMAEMLAEAAFAPSLETMQHFMHRVPGSKDITRMSLLGYAYMSNLCMPSTTPGRSFKRKALLSSLCKLSLPAWGKHEPSRQLHNHHVRALICLLRIIHSHYDHIRSEWDMVLLTFEELSVVTISSPHLSDQMYHAALAISAVYGRFAPFSTCFSDASLMDFVEAMATASSSATQKRDLVATSDNSVLDRVLESSTKPGEKAKAGDKIEDGRESIGGKFLNLGVRAIYGSQQQAGAETSEPNNSYDVPIAKRTKSSFYEAYRSDFVGRLEQTTTSSVKSDVVAMLPFGLALLADVAIANAFRYNLCVVPASKHICSFASVAPAIRTPVVETVSMLILFQLNHERNSLSFDAPARIVYQDPKQHQLLAVEPAGSLETESSSTDVSFEELFAPICDCIRTAKSAVVAEAAITELNSILENVGHILTGNVWVVIINAIASLAGDHKDRKLQEWSNSCMLGFRCLKLIVDNFLDNLPPPSDSCHAARSSLLDCCSSFGRSRHDVNTSLTAIGLLWTIADQDAATDAIDRALSKLVALASDSRPEVRNCSVNTLFSCIVGRGNGFSAQQWESCIVDTIFGVYDLVLSRASASEDGKVDPDGSAVASSKSRYKVNVHHSRDSVWKQWISTQVLTLQGLNRVLRSFFTRLLEHLGEVESTARPANEEEEDDDDDDDEEDSDSDSSDEEDSEYDEDEETDDEVKDAPTSESSGKDKELWLVKAWARILDFALQAAAQEGGRDTVDLRYAGVELLVLCGQLTCRGGIQTATAHVGTKMQVIDGALRGSDDASDPKDGAKQGYQRTHSRVVDDCRESLFLASMTKMGSYREFIETSDGAKQGNTSGMESTQAQVLQKFVTCLSILYDGCKDEELSQGGDLGDKAALMRYFQKPSDKASHLECEFVLLLTAVARAASGGPRFLSQAQRAAMDVLRSMIKHGSSEALLRTISIAGPWLFCRKDEGQDKGSASTADQFNLNPAANLLSSEFAALVAEEIAGVALSDVCKALGLWLSLSQFPTEVANSAERKSDCRRKAYYKNFLPVLHEGLGSALSLQIKAAEADGVESAETLLVDDIWKTLCGVVVSRILTPIPDAAGLQKISRVPEVLEIVRHSIAFVPSGASSALCSVLFRGASEALTVEQANRLNSDEQSDGEMKRRRTKYRDDALLVFKNCYAGICRKKADDPVLLKLTDNALADALATINKAEGANADDNASVDTFLMICQAFQENDGLEELIVSSFPLLCKLVQTNHEAVRNAAAGALGSADLRQVLSDARVRYEDAELRASRAEKEAAELRRAVAELQKKNEALQHG